MFLTPGKGNQHRNRDKARAFVAAYLGIDTINHNTVVMQPFGACHFGAFTHRLGPMIKAENSREYGMAKWHKRQYMMLFRDCGDSCVLYVCPVAPLFKCRNIGHYGIGWEDVEKLAEFKKTVITEE